MREVFGGTGSRFARSRRGRAAWEPRRPASPPCGPAVRTGDPVSKGPCALVAAVSAHGPSGTALPVRTARPLPSLQRARPAVGAGACGLGKVPGGRRPRARPDSRVPASRMPPEQNRRSREAAIRAPSTRESAGSDHSSRVLGKWLRFCKTPAQDETFQTVQAHVN